MCVTCHHNLPRCSYDDDLLRNGLNLGSYEKWMIINRFEQQHAGTYTCRPIPPQNVQSPPLTLALGREWSSVAWLHRSVFTWFHACNSFFTHLTFLRIMWLPLISSKQTRPETVSRSYIEVQLSVCLASIFLHASPLTLLLLRSIDVDVQSENNTETHSFHQRLTVTLAQWAAFSWHTMSLCFSSWVKHNSKPRSLPLQTDPGPLSSHCPRWESCRRGGRPLSPAAVTPLRP